MAGGHDRLVQGRTGEIEAQFELAAVSTRSRGCQQAALVASRVVVAERQPVAFADTLGGTDKGKPSVGTGAHVQSCGDTRAVLAADAPAFELGGNDACIVEDERIAGLQQRRQIANDEIVECAIGFDRQQLCAVARVRWAKRDIVLREIEIEKIDAHWSVPGIKDAAVRFPAAASSVSIRPIRRRRRPSAIRSCRDRRQARLA